MLSMRFGYGLPAFLAIVLALTFWATLIGLECLLGFLRSQGGRVIVFLLAGKGSLEAQICEGGGYI